MYYITEEIFNVAPEVFWIDDVSSKFRKWVQFIQCAATFLTFFTFFFLFHKPGCLG